MVDTHLRHRRVLIQSLLLLWDDRHLLQLLGRLELLGHHHDHHLLRLLRHLVRRTCSFVGDKVHLILHDGAPACWHIYDLLRYCRRRRHLDGDRNFQFPSTEPAHC